MLATLKDSVHLSLTLEEEHRQMLRTLRKTAANQMGVYRGEIMTSHRLYAASDQVRLEVKSRSGEHVSEGFRWEKY